MNILEKISESKKRTAILHSISLDWQYAQQIMPKVLNESGEQSEEFKSLAFTLDILLDDMIKGATELRDLIPKFTDTKTFEAGIHDDQGKLIQNIG